MSKKVTVVRDELDLKGGGLYCFLPFERIDKHKKAVFKIGLATNKLTSINEIARANENTRPNYTGKIIFST